MTDANQASVIQLVATGVGAAVTVTGLVLTYLKSNQAVKASEAAVKTGLENKEELKVVHTQINGHTEAVVKATAQVAALTATKVAEDIAASDAKVALAESEVKIIEAKEVGKAEGRSENKIS